MKTKIRLPGRCLFTGIFLTAAISLFSGCSKDDDGYGSGSGGSGSPGANEVWMQSNAFTPGTRTVTVNTTVTWTNKDGAAHTVTSSSFTGSGNIASGGTFNHTFTAAGTYDYHCALHSNMNGKVIVQ
ncbi:MAG: cupredoxin domain-containing protein [Bacteroidia bacterium]